MTPQTWHYGLVAKWWAEFNEGGPSSLTSASSSRATVAGPRRRLRNGPAASAVPPRRLDVDGCDVSEDIIALCASAQNARGCADALRAADARARPAALVPDDRRLRWLRARQRPGAATVQALERFFQHLEPAARSSSTTRFPMPMRGQWLRWLREERLDLPREWSDDDGERRRASDGTELALQSRLLALDPLDQRGRSRSAPASGETAS